MLARIFAALRKGRTRWAVLGKSRFLTYGKDLHIGAGSILWAPHRILIGNHVYIGKQVHIEANCRIGDFCMIANRVGFVGRHDHDHAQVGFPMRFARWVGGPDTPTAYREESIIVEDEVWVGYGAILMTGTRIGKGSVIAAGSVVTRDIPPYSIVGGNPARVIKRRFEEPDLIDRHEELIATGIFQFSERGYRHWVVRPGARSHGATP
jgi:acetyltransferase-like isoleucine patch superfamily enzyme